MLTIGQRAGEAGIGVETIRFYERAGLLAEADRLASGYRQYPPDTGRSYAVARVLLARGGPIGYNRPS